ncbi:MAG: DASS family sodium-coupled anion symporter [Candidatus Marinimicrobia bacterium]|jgi:anion transporter|nr:DASS family sodium-coupled anion symporter [Candidatus Neomarinimicrobiota bacterium]MBT3618339.1 DASS family sodium-coupled anion symporter [Candidatus Neomarinimicrobiota bacterium]MBT3829134.1 DASS family sodium-coupled anion symporter [Candidatus Neomarinimicrobiota bacterium]MBT3998102.1 DASS family sodium-coupled anion symporter [Candidatus Neomarinimicrobiota bacterium]MBT4281443.1 DASS family sodium-coupled anion symporter [Candidatus Neomarinimicrobiota bacterium]
MDSVLPNSNSGGFAKTTDFKWLGVGIIIFSLLSLMPTPDSMLVTARELFGADLNAEFLIQRAQNMKIILALLGACTIFFATEAIPMPAVALLIGLVQLFFGITDPSHIVGTYAHDAVWFIAGSLAIGATLVKYGLDKRIGMLVVKLSGTKTRNIVFGLLLGTAIPSAFINEASIAPMFVPIALALYTMTNKTIPAPRLGKLLMMSIAIGCMVGAPMSPTGGARNAIMIGFLEDFVSPNITFFEWMRMGVFYTAIMSVIMAFLLPILFKPEVNDLSDAVNVLKKDLEKHGKMTRKQWLVGGIMMLLIFMWITDKSVTASILGFPLGLGGVAISGAVLFMLLGLTSWKDYEENVSWGVIILYAGAISLGSVFKATGAARWLADSLIDIMAIFGISSGLPLILVVILIGALLTNLMSAGATVAVIGPVVLEMAQSSGTNPILVGVGLAISTSLAYWLVIGTPASSIVYASGQLDAKDFIRMATFAWPVAIMVMIAMVIFWWAGVLPYDFGIDVVRVPALGG